MDYVTFGTGDKTLVLLPGLNTQGVRSATFMLAYLYRTYAKEYRVYVIDRKKELPKEYSVRQMAEDTAAALDVLGLTGVYLVGVSMGGMIAQMLTLQRPDLVTKLVLGVTLSRPNEMVVHVVNQWLLYARAGDYQSLNRETFQSMFSPEYLRRHRFILQIAAVISRPEDIHRFITQAEACLDFNVYEELPQISCPVLVIGGERDRVVSAKASYDIANKIGCDIYMCRELGHSAYQEAPDFNKRVYNFFANK